MCSGFLFRKFLELFRIILKLLPLVHNLTNFIFKEKNESEEGLDDRMRSNTTNLEKQNSLESASNSGSYSSDDSTNQKEEVKTSPKHYPTFDDSERKEKDVRRKRSTHEVTTFLFLFPGYKKFGVSKIKHWMRKYVEELEILFIILF